MILYVLAEGRPTCCAIIGPTLDKCVAMFLDCFGPDSEYTWRVEVVDEAKESTEATA